MAQAAKPAGPPLGGAGGGSSWCVLGSSPSTPTKGLGRSGVDPGPGPGQDTPSGRQEPWHRLHSPSPLSLRGRLSRLQTPSEQLVLTLPPGWLSDDQPRGELGTGLGAEGRRRVPPVSKRPHAEPKGGGLEQRAQSQQQPLGKCQQGQQTPPLTERPNPVRTPPAAPTPTSSPDDLWAAAHGVLAPSPGCLQMSPLSPPPGSPPREPWGRWSVHVHWTPGEHGWDSVHPAAAPRSPPPTLPTGP